jgi:hypothetical protein
LFVAAATAAVTGTRSATAPKCHATARKCHPTAKHKHHSAKHRTNCTIFEEATACEITERMACLNKMNSPTALLRPYAACRQKSCQLASQCHQNTMRKIVQQLNYCASHPDAVV